MLITRHSGSEVMGNKHRVIVLHQPTTLCKPFVPYRLRHSLFSYCRHFSMSSLKSQMFFNKKNTFSYLHKNSSVKQQKIVKVSVDIYPGLWQNDICTYRKDFDGKLASIPSSREPAGGVSRCGERKRSDSRVGPVNGSTDLSNGIRLPPLQG